MVCDRPPPSPAALRRCGWLALGLILGLLASGRPAPAQTPTAAVDPVLAARRVLPPADFAPDPASVRRHGPATLFPQAGWLVLHIEGQPYERGEQHGRLLAREIARFIEAHGRFRSPRSPADGWRELRRLTNALMLRRFAPELIEEMQGIADGAAAEGATAFGPKVDLLDIATLNAEIELSALDGALAATPVGLEGQVFPGARPGRPAPPRVDHCSAFLATGPATADGQLVIGHLTMWNLDHARFLNVWLDIQPARGHRILMQTYPGGVQSGTDFGFNDAGLVLCETTLPQTGFEPDSRPLASRTRQALQDADSIDDVVAILQQGNNGLYTNEWLIGDARTNEAALFELGTHASRLWRSSRGEWFGDTPGFYWGCNNTKALEVRLETVPGLEGKPANLVFHPDERDRAWLALFDRHRGQIDARFGIEALTTPPLAAHPGIDAKVATAAQIRQLQTCAVFGPPRGRPWEPSAADLKRDPEITPLAPNDWTVLGPRPIPARAGNDARAVDLNHPWPPVVAAVEPEVQRPPAWHGTLRPDAPGDLWLAAAFSDFEKIVALERDLQQAPDRAQRLAVARFGPLSRYLTARARAGTEVPLTAPKPELRDDAWYDQIAGKGTLALDALRRTVGPERFDPALDRFGRAHAGRPATTAEFFAALAGVHDGPLDRLQAGLLGSDPLAALGPEVSARAASGRFWTVTSFEHDPGQAVIVYGTLAETESQRAAAGQLQAAIRQRWWNLDVPIVADTELTDADRRSRHLLLVGRPATNRVSQALADALPVRFGPASVRIEQATYAHPETALIVAGPNPQAAARSVVLFAGLSGSATLAVVEQLPNPELRPWPDAAELVLIEAGGGPRSRVLPGQPPAPARAD